MANAAASSSNTVRLMQEVQNILTLQESRHGHAPRQGHALHVEPIYISASDFGWVNRPRLW